MAKVKSTTTTAIEDSHDRNLMPRLTFEYTGYNEGDTPPNKANRLTAVVQVTVTNPDGSTETVSRTINISDSGIPQGQWIVLSQLMDKFIGAALAAEGYADE